MRVCRRQRLCSYHFNEHGTFGLNIECGSLGDKGSLKFWGLFCNVSYDVVSILSPSWGINGGMYIIAFLFQSMFPILNNNSTCNIMSPRNVSSHNILYLSLHLSLFAMSVTLRYPSIKKPQLSGSR